MVENTSAKYYEGALIGQTMIKQECLSQSIFGLLSFPCLKCFQDLGVNFDEIPHVKFSSSEIQEFLLSLQQLKPYTDTT